MHLKMSSITSRLQYINSLAPGKFEWNLRYGWGISCEIALIWMPLDFTDGQSTLVQVMAWCRQATSHYLNQCWPRPYGVTRPQWVKQFRMEDALCILSTNCVPWTCDLVCLFFHARFPSWRWPRADQQCWAPTAAIRKTKAIDLFHNNFSPSGLQPEHRKLSVGVLQLISLWNHGGYVTDGAQIKRYCVLCSKHIAVRVVLS